jgi:hypothetical protein
MNRKLAIRARLLALSGLALVFVQLTPDLGNKPAVAGSAPWFTAALRHSPSCEFRLIARWRGAQVGSVIAQWHLDGAFLATSNAPGTGPNGGKITGNAAVMGAGPFAPREAYHAWKVLVQFYSGSGAQLASIWSNVDNARCAP